MIQTIAHIAGWRVKKERIANNVTDDPRSMRKERHGIDASSRFMGMTIEAGYSKCDDLSSVYQTTTAPRDFNAKSSRRNSDTVSRLPG